MEKRGATSFLYMIMHVQLGVTPGTPVLDSRRRLCYRRIAKSQSCDVETFCYLGTVHFLRGGGGGLVGFGGVHRKKTVLKGGHPKK